MLKSNDRNSRQLISISLFRPHLIIFLLVMQTHNKWNDEKREENRLENVDEAEGKVGSECFILFLVQASTGTLTLQLTFSRTKWRKINDLWQNIDQVKLFFHGPLQLWSWLQKLAISVRFYHVKMLHNFFSIPSTRLLFFAVTVFKLTKKWKFLFFCLLGDLLKSNRWTPSQRVSIHLLIVVASSPLDAPNFNFMRFHLFLRTLSVVVV